MATSVIKIDFDSLQDAKSTLEDNLRNDGAVNSFQRTDFFCASNSSSTRKMNDYLEGLSETIRKTHESLANEVLFLSKANSTMQDTESHIKTKAVNLGGGGTK